VRPAPRESLGRAMRLLRPPPLLDVRDARPGTGPRRRVPVRRPGTRCRSGGGHPRQRTDIAVRRAHRSGVRPGRPRHDLALEPLRDGLGGVRGVGADDPVVDLGRWSSGHRPRSLAGPSHPSAHAETVDARGLGTPRRGGCRSCLARHPPSAAVHSGVARGMGRVSGRRTRLRDRVRPALGLLRATDPA
jgi:hypothetical protein